ncbi:MAG: IclR family transcriptional regulator [Rhodobacteraceae bacterium]|jgi:IclR family acetate operon transcriptional repressor|nr:IclR family transcriptional regulator [Paracoccaceae bacterium]
MPKTPDDSYVVQPVEKALLVLAYVAECGHVVSLKSVSTVLGIPKTTAFRYLQTLTRAGFLSHDSRTDRYSGGPRLGAIARTNARIDSARELARPLMRDLTAEYDGTVNLAVKGDGSVVYLDVFEPPGGFRTKARSGDAHPLHSTALGKAILAFMPEEESLSYLSRPLTERTGRTLIDRAELIRQLRLVARRGYAMETGENEDGAMCVGVPILDERGYPLVALSVTLPLQRMSPSHAMKAGNRLVDAARSISARMAPAPATRAMAAALPGH